MIAKKNPRYNLEGKRIVIFSLGLLTTTAATLAAFTYQSPYEHELEKHKIPAIPIDYMVEDEKPEVVEKPLAEPQIQQPMQQQQSDPSQSVALSSSLDISQDINLVSNRPDLPDLGILGRPDVQISEGGGNEIEKEPIEFPGVEAQFVGGYPKMQEFIIDNTNYPEGDLNIGNSGVVYVSFVVELDGSISNVVVEKGVSKDIDREAKRVVKAFPNWIPGENDGEKVRTIIRLPIRFIPQ